MGNNLMQDMQHYTCIRLSSRQFNTGVIVPNYITDNNIPTHRLKKHLKTWKILSNLTASQLGEKVLSPDD